MASLAVQAPLVALGVALTFGGLFVYRRGLIVFGGLMGLGLAFFGTSVLGVSGGTQAAIVVLTGIVAAALSQILYVVLVAVPGAVTGFGVAMFATGTTLSNAADPVVVVGAVLGAAVALVLRQAVVAGLSATWGPILVWAGVETEAIVAALAEFTVPTLPTWVFALAALGLVVQAGVWASLREDDLLAGLRDDDEADSGPGANARVGDAGDELGWEGDETGGTETSDSGGTGSGSDTPTGDD